MPLLFSREMFVLSSYVCCIYCCILLLYRNTYALTIPELADFFNSTYIRRETAEWNPKIKGFAVPGYSPSWDMYSFHHVCLQKGAEGIFIGLKDVPTNWKDSESEKTSKHYLVSEAEWNNLKHVSDLKKNLLETYTAKRLDVKTKSYSKIIYLDEATFFFNCEQHSRDVMAHGDWVVKHGVLYELANFFRKNKGKKTFKYKWPTPFKTVFMNRCNDPEKADWNFGSPIMEVIKRRTDAHEVTKSGYTNYLRTPPSDDSTDLVCFENMYLSGRLSATLHGQDTLIEFRKDAATFLGEPKEVLSDTEEEIHFIPGFVQQAYCKQREFRIKVLQVQGEQDKRKILNLNDVVSVLQRFSTVPIEVLEISRNMSLPEIIDYFNSFDILVTPVGSHLIHGMFTAFPFTKGVIEISPFLKDPYYHRIFSKHFQFADYVVSTGHYSHGIDNNCPFQKQSFFDYNCNRSFHSYFNRFRQERYICPSFYNSALDCDITVNLTILAKHTGMLIYQSLCKPGMPLFDNMTSIALNSELARARYNDTVVTSTEKFGNYTSKFKGVNSASVELRKFMIPNPPKIMLPPDSRYPKSRHLTYGYYRVLDRALNISSTGKYIGRHNKYYLSIIAIFKNEASVIKEWIDHHIGHGVEHFYLVNDGSTDKPEDVLKPYISSGVVTLHPPPSQNIPFRQAALYKKLFTEVYSKNETRWVALIDIDEFLYSPVEVDLRVILKNHEALAVVGLNWVWFGSSGLIQQPKSVIQSFVNRADTSFSKYPALVQHYGVLSNPDEWQKNIINTGARVDNVDVHAVAAEGISASLGYSAFPENPLILLNHYSTQSKDFFLKNKGIRGDVNNWIAANARNEEWFAICDINDIADTRLKDQNLKYKIAV